MLRFSSYPSFSTCQTFNIHPDILFNHTQTMIQTQHQWHSCTFLTSNPYSGWAAIFSEPVGLLGQPSETWLILHLFTSEGTRRFWHFLSGQGSFIRHQKLPGALLGLLGCSVPCLCIFSVAQSCSVINMQDILALLPYKNTSSSHPPFELFSCTTYCNLSSGFSERKILCPVL